MARARANTSRHVAAKAGEDAASGRRFDLRTWVRSSPWITIAVLLHVLLVTVMSVVYVQTQRVEAPVARTAISVGQAAPELPPAIEEHGFLERDQIPPAPREDVREVVVLVEPDLTSLLEGAAGKVGDESDGTDPSLDPGIYNPDPEALATLPSGAIGGTPLGVGKVGHVGGGTSPFSSRKLGRGGPGGGGPAGEGGRGPGQDERRMDKAVLDALLWLERHQSPDGSWDADGFSARCAKNPCTGLGDAAHDVGVTGLALLAFLGAGQTHEDGRFKKTVKEGLQWLMRAQDEQGCFGERIGHQFLYDHACAALAMAEAFGMTQSKPLRVPAQKGILFVLRSQTPYAGWRYASPSDGDSDTSVTGWMVMVLKSGKLAGLTIDDQAMLNALGWIDEVTDDASGRTGYTARGQRPSRLPDKLAAFPPEHVESMTAVGLLTRIFAGRTPANDPMIAKGADLLVASLPRWDAASHVDFYYWYYGTLAMFQVGGAHWNRWNEAIKSAVLDHQRTNPDEDEHGSWDPVDPWSSVGGRIYATALNCLSMEVYYRYPRVFGTK